jgi:type II secretory pathway predicted ATPase ExeA
MYAKFFGLLENPFTSSPDPKYFFNGKNHKEALLHLQYSVSQGEGFTLITGKKGIGKTTVCRAFIECPDEQVKTAFLSYSKQNSEKLLKKICEEFGIKARRETLKDLTDTVNNFLMQKRTEGKRVVVFLDDAHKHNKHVLEQLRLLSNLETTRDKLLQIVLIGRPQLSDMLNSHDLRPLGQRVTVSYHLRPLSEDETCQYIIHRIAIAGQGVTVKFEPSAIKQIYKYSNGTPQIINSVCDKALMEAFKLHHKHVSAEIVRTVIKDLKSRPKLRFKIHSFSSIRGHKLFGVASVLFLVLCVSAAILFRGKTREIRPEIVKIKIPEDHSNYQIQETPPPEVEKIRHDDPEIVKFDATSQIQNPNKDEKDGRLGDISRQITYSVQVGAYLILRNAQDKITILNEKGYAAQIVNFEDHKGRIWHTVRIGNFASREMAKKDAKILYEQDEIEGVVLPSNKF